MRLVIFLAALGMAGSALGADPAIPQKRKIEIKVTEDGFEPREVPAKKGETVTLVFTRTAEVTCITAIDIPDENVKKLELPLNKEVRVEIKPKKAGVEPFHCSAMGEGDGKIVVSD